MKKTKDKTEKYSGNLIKALVQNYGFKRTEFNKLPTMDYVYPDFTGNGNTESYRFSAGLRKDLASRSGVVTADLTGKNIAWTSNERVLLDVDKIAPRLGLEDQITGKINSIYAYPPLLFIATGNQADSFTSYVVKPVISGFSGGPDMAWFEMTSDEKVKTQELIDKYVTEKPYRSLMQRVFGK
jgi:hypothetical protein